MPETPTTPSRGVDMSSAPGGDINWDELFGTDPESAPAQPAAPATPAPPAQPVETQPSEAFLKTPTGTVYKTQEEAIRGFTHKDEVIESLRRKYAEATGKDPITGKDIPQAQPESAPAPLWDRMEAAVKAGDKMAYERALQEFVIGTISPYAPALNEVVQQHSVDKVNASIKGFRDWRYSEEFNSSIAKFPVLQTAIAAAETNPALSQQLPELYQLAYWTFQGQRTPEINATVAATNLAPVVAPAPPRPTTSPTTQPPMQNSARPDLRTSEGRKAIIAAAESRGVADLPWDQVWQR